MYTYEIYTEICLGFSHCGGEYCDGSAQITLTDEQVATLRSIMEKAYAEGKDLNELDLRDTDLEKENPELYKLIYDAYYDCAYEAEYEYWVVEGYHRSEVLDGIDWEHARDICKERYGYNPQDVEAEYYGYDDLDESEEGEADEVEEVAAEYDKKFQNWFMDNIAYSDKVVDFERAENLLGVEVDREFDSPLLIPADLVKEFLGPHK